MTNTNPFLNLTGSTRAYSAVGVAPSQQADYFNTLAPNGTGRLVQEHRQTSELLVRRSA